MVSMIQNVDWSILNFIQQHLRCGLLDSLMPFITNLGNLGAIWIFTAMLLMLMKKHRRCGVTVLLGIAAGFVIGNLMLKPLIARPRPCMLDTAMPLLIPAETDFSMPSGHMLAAVIAAALLTWEDKRFGWVMIPLAALMGFSRLYLYQHFPSDIMAALALGLLIAWITRMIVKRAYPLLARRFRSSPADA
ncbi:MAG: phosphatase PAP2 family protein [Eubacteriales bacterium]|nr:phosphatase PAP2 family protein [Eubacteriales bacterium]